MKLIRSNLWRHAGEAGVVYTAFLLRAFSFLLLAPLFTRVIRPETWGAVLAAQALATWLILLLEFGFSLSLAQHLAIERHDPEQVRRRVGGIMSAKLMLTVLVLALTWVASGIGVLRDHPALAWWAGGWAVAQGLSPVWYFQAVEQMRWFSVVDIFGRLAYLVLAALLVRETEQAYLVLALLAITSALTSILTFRTMLQRTGGVPLSLAGGRAALREGLTLSGFTLVTSIYSTASVFLFALLAPGGLVAVYGNADRLVRAGISVMAPLNQLLLPRSARAFASSSAEGWRLARRYLVLYGVFGLVALALGWWLAPWIVGLMYGRAYEGSVHYFRWLLCLVPLTALNTVLAYHVLLPTGRATRMTAIYMAVSLLSLGLLWTLVPTWQGDGMLVAMLMPEVAAGLLLLVTVWRLRRAGFAPLHTEGRGAL